MGSGQGRSFLSFHHPLTTGTYIQPRLTSRRILTSPSLFGIFAVMSLSSLLHCNISSLAILNVIYRTMQSMNHSQRIYSCFNRYHLVCSCKSSIEAGEVQTQSRTIYLWMNYDDFKLTSVKILNASLYASSSAFTRARSATTASSSLSRSEKLGFVERCDQPILYVLRGEIDEEMHDCLGDQILDRLSYDAEIRSNERANEGSFHLFPWR